MLIAVTVEFSNLTLRTGRRIVPFLARARMQELGASNMVFYRDSIALAGFSSTALALAIGGCVQTQWHSAGYGVTQTMLIADHTMDVEVSDRINRFRHLANLQDVVSP